eukprot:CAMPEP_0198432076 /NCGR_PEP_ID=MMETSP1452-20131203/21574_1 /TAXON_ID=1181717 /ORGANISM="Synchroma pusillum, Strain CCMP3072" /LENGTH=290 /DNA_ID=CAMNT_0044152547 /DNA_START=1 /DNA_END=872 /DNA_ORIENTATION=+
MNLMPSVARSGAGAMPHNNRVSASAALKTTAIWQNVIGYDPYAGDAEKKADSGQTEEHSHQLLMLARMQGLGGAEARGACKRCGQVGHLAYTCRNPVASSSAGGGGADSDSSSDSDDDDDDGGEAKAAGPSARGAAAAARDERAASSRRDRSRSRDRAPRRDDRERDRDREDRRRAKKDKKERKREKKERKRDRKERKEKAGTATATTTATATAAATATATGTATGTGTGAATTAAGRRSRAARIPPGPRAPKPPECCANQAQGLVLWSAGVAYLGVDSPRYKGLGRRPR